MKFLEKATVEAVSIKPRTFNDKETGQPKTLDSYSIKVVADGKGEMWIGCGFKNPNVGNGDVISIGYTENGKFLNIVKDSITIISKGEAPAPTPAAPSMPAQAKSYGKPSPNVFEEKDKKAALGFAREQAIKTMTAMKQFNAISSEMSGDEFLTQLDTLTARYIEQANTFVSTGELGSVENPPTIETGESLDEGLPFDDSVDF